MNQTTRKASSEFVLPILSGKRIYLRGVRQTDVNENYCAWLNDPEVNQFLETRFSAQSIESISAFVRCHEGHGDEPFFAICLSATDEHIGNIKLGPINWHHRNADVSLLIGNKSCWGKGYATEAIGLVTRYAFEDLKLNKLQCGAYATNAGSARAFEKCGYQREGLLRGYALHNDVEVDVVLFGIRAKEFAERIDP